MYEGSDSFGEWHSEIPVHPASPCRRHKSELRQDFESRLFLLPYLCVRSLPVIQTPLPEPRHSSDLTSSAISCLLLEPYCLNAGTGDSLLLHYCANNLLCSVFYYFVFEVISVCGRLKISSGTDCYKIGKFGHALCIISFDIINILTFPSFFVCNTHKWRKFGNFHSWALPQPSLWEPLLLVLGTSAMQTMLEEALNNSA